MYRKLFIFICFIVATVFTWAQNYSFEHITTTEGLSQNDVNDIYQDKNGFLWIGTNDGLNRYDGYNFKTYRIDLFESKGLGSNLIYRIAEDDDGNLWLGTSDKGIYRFDMKTEQFQSINDLLITPQITIFDQVTSLVPTKNGDIWIGSSKGIGFYKRDKEKYSFTYISNTQFPALNSNIITCMSEDVYGRMWIGTQTGLYVLIEENGTFRVVTVNGGSYVRDIIIKQNTLLVAYTEGVFFLEFDWESLTNFRSIKVANETVNSALLSQNRDLFIGTYNGMYHYPKKSFNRYSYSSGIHYQQNWESNSLNKYVVNCLFEDKSGIIWIGTNGGGLNKCNPKQKKFRHFAKSKEERSLSYNKIRAIYEDGQKNIWIGTEGGGLNFLPASEKKNFANGFQHLNVNTTGNQNHVYSIIEITSNNQPQILVGSGYPSVLNVYEAQNNSLLVKDKGVFDDIINSPFCSLKDRHGNVWFGTYGVVRGLYKYSIDEDGHGQLQSYAANTYPGSLVSNRIRSLLQDNYGNIWIGTDNGLNMLPPEQQNVEKPKFHLYQTENNKNSLSHNYILPMYQSSDKTIWIGTMGGGLNKVIYNNNPDSIYFEAVTTQEGLPNNVIKGILEDDYGFLWISSNNGLTRYDANDHIFINYDVSDGLQDNEFSELACYKLSDGEMLFGGVNGFNAFYPKDIIRDMSAPEVALTDFHILNESVQPGTEVNGRVVLDHVINHTDEIKLKYAENSFAIYFSSLHFAAPQKNVYKYMLEGFDSDWIRKDASDRIAKYTNLNPGSYTFKILASNNDGIWSNKPKVLTIIVTPPWYLSALAWIIYVVLFILLMVFFQRYSLIRIKQKNELIMEHFEKEKIQELSQMKLRFFTNISHEFRTPLTLIIGPLEKLIKQGGHDKAINDSFSIMHRNASILLRLINQLIDFRKFEQGKMKLNAAQTDIVPFMREVFSSFSELSVDKKIEYHFTTSRKKIDVWFDGDKLERIMYNLLSNAFKFTAESGNIEVIINEDEFDVIIEVVDNGSGISKENQQHIFERFYQAKQIQNRKVGSTGIGLSFIKGLVELHKGEISFESEEGKGTTFYVKLKKGNAHLSEEEMVGSEDFIPTGKIVVPEPNLTDGNTEDETESTSKPKVLLVEDNFELRKFIKDSLKTTYKIAVADNGKEGIEKAKDFNPDVIVSDIMMPVLSGFELCETIKTDETLSHIPIILLTARSTAENRMKGYKLGADAYISKPFKIDVLEVRIQNLIDSRNKLRNKLRTNVSVEPSEVTTTSMDEKLLKRMLRVIEDNISDPEFKVSQLAQECGMSQINLNKKIKGLTGLTPKVFVRTIRLKRAAQLIITAKYSISEIAFEVGFLDIKYFRGCFKEEFGVLPSEYKNNNTESS